MSLIESSPYAGGRAERELIAPDSPLAPFILVNPGRMHDEPCFRGSRVPVQHLFDHLRADDPLAEVLEGFPTVSREQAVAVIDLAAEGLLRTFDDLLVPSPGTPGEG